MACTSNVLKLSDLFCFVVKYTNQELDFLVLCCRTSCKIDINIKCRTMPAQQTDDPITEVWSTNIEAEFKKIRKIVKQYNYIAMVIIIYIYIYLTN